MSPRPGQLTEDQSGGSSAALSHRGAHQPVCEDEEALRDTREEKSQEATRAHWMLLDNTSLSGRSSSAGRCLSCG
ncbi:MAG: hypothetical protein INR71_16040 [Terriglobus roseus]|nr:hypothetical protein [Terriglobus roseus]